MDEPAGLRQRKRLATMRRIQEAALDLFDEHGYGQVTIERIAERAEVSASTVYRYFGTKERIVLSDEYDPLVVEAISKELPTASPVEAVRRATMTVLTQQLTEDAEYSMRRVRYVFEEPTVRASLLAMAEEITQLAAHTLAPMLNRSPDDLELQVVLTAIMQSLLTAFRLWYESDPSAPVEPFLERTFALLESGLQLPPAPADGERH